MVDTIKWSNADAPPGGDGSQLSPYDSLSVWNSNNAGVIGAGNRHIVNFRSGISDDTSYLDLSGWSGAGELIIQRWPGAPTAVLRPSGGVGHAILTPEMDITLDYFDIDMSSMTGDSEEGVRWAGGGLARKLRIRNGSVNRMDGIYFLNNGLASTIVIEDCEISNMDRGGILNQAAGNKSVIIVNCSVYSCMRSRHNGVYSVVGYQDDRDLSPLSTMRVVNCPVHCENSSCFSEARTNGVFTDSDYNIASDDTGSVVGANSYSNVAFQQGAGGSGQRAMFVSLSPVVDMHIIDDANNLCRGNGAGPTDPIHGSIVPTTDYDGDPRSGLTCDIGFDEISTGGTELFLDASLNLSSGVGVGKVSDIPAESALGASTGLTGEPLGEFPVDALVQANAGIAGETLGDFPVDAALTASAEISGQTLGDFPVDAALQASAEIQADLGLILDFDAVLEASASIAGEGEAGIFFDAVLAASVGISGQTLGEFPVDATLALSAGISGQTLGDFPVDAQLQVNAGIEASLTSDMLLDGALDAQAGLTADRDLDFDLVVPKSRILCVEGQDRILRVEHQNRILRVEE